MSPEPSASLQTVWSFRFGASSLWHAADEVFTSQRLTAFARLFASNLELAAEVNLTPALVQYMQFTAEMVRLQVSALSPQWQFSPLRVTTLLEVDVAVETQRLPLQQQDALAALTPKLQNWLHAALGPLVERAAAATGVLTEIAPLQAELQTMHSNPISSGDNDSTPVQLQLEDLAAVRSERIPVEFTLLFDFIGSSPHQRVSLADLLDVAKTMALNDDLVLEAVNFYIAKQYLSFDRQHALIRLTATGRAASTVKLADGQSYE